MVERIPMTVKGAEALKKKLEDLKFVQRPDVIKAISEARAHGDLSENAEYHAAKERQGFIEAHIRDIEQKLSQVQIIDVTKLPNNGRVVFGATVHLINQDTDEQVTYQIVGNDEAEVKENKISVQSPIARALIGKEAGEEVVVKTPSGDVYYEIDDVDYI